MKLKKGSHNATGLKFGIVVSKFNKFVTSKLLSSCVEGLTKHGVVPEDIEVVRVPGAFEIPLVAKTLAGTKRFDAVICRSCRQRPGLTPARRHRAVGGDGRVELHL